MHEASPLKQHVMKKKCSKDGKPLSRQATHQKVKRKKEKILKTLEETCDGDEGVKKIVLHKVLLDQSMGHVSKSVLTEIFNSEDWQNQSVPLESTDDDESEEMVPTTKTPKITEIEIADEMSVNHSSMDKEKKQCENDNLIILERSNDMDVSSSDCSQSEMEPESMSFKQLCDDTNHEMAIRFHQNLKQIVQLILENKGKFPNDQERFMRILFTAICNCSEPTKRDVEMTAEALGLSECSARRRMLRARKNRMRIFDSKKNSFKFVVKQLRKKKINDELIRLIVGWVINHQNVRDSPNVNDTLKMPDGSKVGKKILEISVNDLHNDLAKSGIEGILDSEQRVIIGHETFRLMLKKEIPYLKKATDKHMQMCCCNLCLTAMKYQEVLNVFRNQKIRELTFAHEQSVRAQKNSTNTDKTHQNLLRSKCRQLKNRLMGYKDFSHPKNEPRHQKCSEALRELMCEKVKINGREHWKWKCVLRRCKECQNKKLITHPFETTLAPQDSITFQHYIETTRCSEHGVLGTKMLAKERVCKVCESSVSTGVKKGKISTKKEKHSCTVPIGSFLKNYYEPFLREYQFHHPHMKILSNDQAIRERKEAFFNDVNALLTAEDYAEAIKCGFNLQIYADHFGTNPTIKLEGATATFHNRQKKQKEKSEYDTSKEEESDVEKHQFSHFSDDAKQHASTSFENMKKMFECLQKLGHLIAEESVVYDHTDGCSSQYRSALALYLLTMLSGMFKVPIDRLVNAAGHGKNEVDGSNAVTNDTFWIA